MIIDESIRLDKIIPGNIYKVVDCIWQIPGIVFVLSIEKESHSVRYYYLGDSDIILRIPMIMAKQDWEKIYV
mgnify:CR=1 FL=1